MTALLESPGGTLDVSLLEERQPDVPLTCTLGHFIDGHEPCPKTAVYEGICMGCGHIRRRCEPHYQREADTVLRAEVVFGDYSGQTSLCVRCEAPWYLAQYVRIGA